MKNKTSVYLIVALSLFVALLHFLIGPNYQGFLKDFIRGYLIDFLLPLNMYLLLQISLRQHLTVQRARLTAAIAVFSFGVLVEVLQLNRIPFLGRTYDLMDILMYGLGVGAGILIDLTIINHLEKKKGQ